MTKITLCSFALVLRGLLSLFSASLSSAQPVGGYKVLARHDDKGCRERWPGSRNGYSSRVSESISKAGGRAMADDVLDVTPSISGRYVPDVDAGLTTAAGPSWIKVNGCSRCDSVEDTGDAGPNAPKGSSLSPSTEISLGPDAIINYPSISSGPRNPITAPTQTRPGTFSTDKRANRVAAGAVASTSGKATWYNPGLGSCGKMDSDSDLVVALATTNMAGGKHCNKNIKITDLKTGKIVMAKVRDTCPSCAMGDLDMSPSLFQKFQSLDVGAFNMMWNFV